MVKRASFLPLFAKKDLLFCFLVVCTAHSAHFNNEYRKSYQDKKKYLHDAMIKDEHIIHRTLAIARDRPTPRSYI